MLKKILTSFPSLLVGEGWGEGLVFYILLFSEVKVKQQDLSFEILKGCF